MKEAKKTEVKNVENVEDKNVNKEEVEIKRLSMPATVLITIAATLGAIVVARVIYFIITGA